MDIVNNEQIWQRVQRIMNMYNLNKNSFSVATGINAVTIGKIINYGRKPNSATIDKILKAYPNINKNWLVLGEGEMINERVEVEQPNLLSEQEFVRRLLAKDDKIEELELIIKQQASKIDYLDRLLTANEIKH